MPWERRTLVRQVFWERQLLSRPVLKTERIARLHKRPKSARWLPRDNTRRHRGVLKNKMLIARLHKLPKPARWLPRDEPLSYVLS